MTYHLIVILKQVYQLIAGNCLTNSYHYVIEFHSNKELPTGLFSSCTSLTVNLPTSRASSKFFLEDEARAGDFFCVFSATNWKGEAKDFERKSRLTGVEKSCFSSRDAQKKNTIVLVHAIKTNEFKYRIYSYKRRGSDTIKIKRC